MEICSYTGRQEFCQIIAVGIGLFQAMEEAKSLKHFLDTAMAKKILKQFLLIQQFWLMGTTSIPQPIITTAQFPISASHAGMP